MRNKIIAGNWKMNMDISEGLNFLDQFRKLIESDLSNKKVIIFPPFIHLFEFGQLLKETPISYGAQNIHYESKGAYTGEISGPMIKSTGAEYVIIGHSERRKYFNEGNQLLANKLDASLDNEIIPIYCCGETLAERESGEHFNIVESQIKEGLFHLTAESFRKVIIAYEPVWAIGTGKTASADQAQKMHSIIRKILTSKYGIENADNTSILYGGSIKSSNSKELFQQIDIDGGLIGGASLIPEEFNNIINSI